MSAIADNWARVGERVDAAARRSGRQAKDVTVVVASKTKPIELIDEAIAAGARDFGENYVQEAAAKVPLRCDSGIRWHLIGHLQRNKAARAVELFDVIQSVDSIPLATALARHADKASRALEVMIEVNLGGELTKSGLVATHFEAATAPLFELASAIAALPSLQLSGLMTIPPPSADAEQARRFFGQLRQMNERLSRELGVTLPHLSMGMSDDFEVAIEEGATRVRIGTAILGKR